MAFKKVKEHKKGGKSRNPTEATANVKKGWGCHKHRVKG